MVIEQEASRNKCHASSNRCLTSSNKKLLVTSATTAHPPVDRTRVAQVRAELMKLTPKLQATGRPVKRPASHG